MSKKIKHEVHTFYADTRFEKLARRPGGAAREKALAHAQAQVDELKPEFTDWLNRELQELNVALSRIDGNSSDKLWVDCAYRSCSQLRDVAATIGFELVTFIANNLCDVLEAIKAGAPYDKDVIDCHTNAFLLARSEAYRHLRPEQVPEMASGLRRVSEIASIAPAQKGK